MKILGFDLLSLFRAPVVTEEPVIPEPQEPMPGEYMETDTDAPVSSLTCGMTTQDHRNHKSVSPCIR